MTIGQDDEAFDIPTMGTTRKRTFQIFKILDLGRKQAIHDLSPCDADKK
jgi:hypothetical protein